MRLSHVPLSALGASIAHAGVGVTLLGLAATGWGVESVIAMAPLKAYEVGPYQLMIEEITPRQGPNYFRDLRSDVCSKARRNAWTH